MDAVDNNRVNVLLQKHANRVEANVNEFAVLMGIGEQKVCVVLFTAEYDGLGCIVAIILPFARQTFLDMLSDTLAVFGTI